MKKKRGVLLGLSLLSFSVTAAQAFTTVTLQNATWCKATRNGFHIVKTEKVLPIDIFSFYYASQEKNSRTYYSTIPAGKTGVAAVGDYIPFISPPEKNIELGFSPSPAYTSGSLSFVSSVADKVNGWYLYQVVDEAQKDIPPGYCTFGPCIGFDETNPCAQLSLATVK